MIWHYKADCHIKTACFLGLALLFSTKLQNFARFRTNLGLDNVFIERFWRSLKQEKIYLIILNTVKEVKNAITDYITFYNSKRMHQSLEYLTTEQVYLTKIIC